MPIAVIHSLSVLYTAASVIVPLVASEFHSPRVLSYLHSGRGAVLTKA
jgi:hypothetical protein